MKRHSRTLMELDLYKAKKEQKLDIVKYLKNGLWRRHPHDPKNPFYNLDDVSSEFCHKRILRSIDHIHFETEPTFIDIEMEIFNMLVAFAIKKKTKQLEDVRNSVWKSFDKNKKTYKQWDIKKIDGEDHLPNIIDNTKRKIEEIARITSNVPEILAYKKKIQEIEEEIHHLLHKEAARRHNLESQNKIKQIKDKKMEPINRTTYDTPAITGTPAIEAPADPKNVTKPQTEESKAAKTLANKRARHKTAVKTGVKAYLYADDFKLKTVIFTVVAREKNYQGHDALLHVRYRIVKDETKLHKPTLKDDIYDNQQVKNMIASDILSKSNSEEYSADKIADLMIRAEEYIENKKRKVTENKGDTSETSSVRRTDQYIFEGEKWGPYEVKNVTPSYGKVIKSNPVTGKKEVFSTNKIIGYKVEALLNGKDIIKRSQSAYASIISKYGYKKPDAPTKGQQLLINLPMSETNNGNVVVGKTEMSNSNKTDATKIEELHEKLNGLTESNVVLTDIIKKLVFQFENR